MPLTPQQLRQIVGLIGPIFDQVLNEYSYAKYPAADYQRFQNNFSTRTATNLDIEQAMIWKWGHWGKPDFPRHHKNLITEIQELWPEFLRLPPPLPPQQTYEWWEQKLARTTTYITAAYIAHLVHYSEPLPIIDQHNFRAMNCLIKYIDPGHRSKKKPSRWTDIAALKEFMAQLISVLPNRTFSELDRFLMMYGRNHVPR